MFFYVVYIEREGKRGRRGKGSVGGVGGVGGVESLPAELRAISSMNYPSPLSPEWHEVKTQTLN